MSIPLPLNAFSQVPRTAGPFQTAYGINAAPASRIAAYVRSGGVQDGDDTFIMNNLVTTMDEAFKRCRSGMNDVVFVLPGHAENVSTTDFGSSLVAGTNVIGLGSGGAKPQITWTVTAANWSIGVTDCLFQNLDFNCAGPGTTLTVNGAMTVDGFALDTTFVGCKFVTALTSSQKCNVALSVTGDRLKLLACDFLGDDAGETTTQLSISGSDAMQILGCNFMGATTVTTNGLIRFTGETVDNMLLEGVNLQNRKALSVNAISNSGPLSGVMKSVAIGILDTATLSGMSGKSSLQFFDCAVSNLAGETGAAMAPVST